MSILATIGLPRSGKSTFSREFLESPLYVSEKTVLMGKDSFNREYAIPRPKPRIVVRADDIRLSFGQRYNEAIEDYVDAIKHTTIKVYHAQAYEVLVDGTHTTWKSIKKILLIDPEAKFQWMLKPNWKINKDHYTMSVYDNLNWRTHIQECLNRATKTKQEDLRDIIYRMSTQIEELSKDWEDKLLAERKWAREYKEHVA